MSPYSAMRPTNDGVQLRYSYRLYPTRGQRSVLARAFGCARVVFNDALRLREQAHAAGLPYLTDADLSARLTAAKATPDRAWLAGVSSVVLQQSLADLNAAYRNFFASLTGTRKGPKAGLPRFRSRKDRRQAIRCTASARFKILPSGRLRLPKIGDVPVRWSRDLPSAPASVTVIRDCAGRHFASFVVRTGTAADAARFPGTGAEAGIDLGLTWFAVLSDGTVIRSPKFLRRAERKLRRLGKSLARKQPGSSNRAMARVAVARAHARVADSGRDFRHQTSTAIIRGNQAVYAGDLCVAGLGRTRLAKSVRDAGWSAFVNMLEYKVRRYGRYFGKIGRRVPSAGPCSACGVNGGPKPLNVRQWTCTGCGAVHDRDLNAAKNILALGRRERLNACGDSVRPPLAVAAVRETGTLRGAA
jgi:putative transposase